MIEYFWKWTTLAFADNNMLDHVDAVYMYNTTGPAFESRCIISLKEGVINILLTSDG